MICLNFKQNIRNTIRQKFVPVLLSCAFSFFNVTVASGVANFVYHEQTSNFVATPLCSGGGTNSVLGRYLENIDRSGTSGFQVYSTESYLLRYKVEYLFFTNRLRVYYTTNNSNPSGSFGTPFGTTQVVAADYTGSYQDQTRGCQSVDVAAGSIPQQPAGTVVKYIVGAWHTGGGPEVFGNSGTCSGCFSCTDSTIGCATVFQYSVLTAPTAASVSVSGRVLTGNRRGLSNALVYLTDSEGNTRRSRTNSFGYYQFNDIAAGQTVTITVVSKRYLFSSQVLNLNEEMNGVNFLPDN